jgi:hypothetical protein
MDEPELLENRQICIPFQLGKESLPNLKKGKQCLPNLPCR